MGEASVTMRNATWLTEDAKHQIYDQVKQTDPTLTYDQFLDTYYTIHPYVPPQPAETIPVLVPRPPIITAPQPQPSTTEPSTTTEPPRSQSIAARSYGGLGLPIVIIAGLWRLREKYVPPWLHRKLHPLV